MRNLTAKANNPVYVVNCFLKGFRLLSRPGLRQYLIMPILINIVLYSVALGLGYYYLTDIIASFIPSWLSWLEWLVYPLFFISFATLGFFSFTVVANILAAPFYSQLSAKSLAIISEQTIFVEEVPIRQVFLSEFKRFNYLMVRMLPLLILFIIPGVNLVAPFLWLLFGAWGMGLEYLAYPLENNGLLFIDQRNIARRRRIGVLSFGGITVFGLSIPVLHLVVAPVAVIAATAYVYGLAEDDLLR